MIRPLATLLFLALSALPATAGELRVRVLGLASEAGTVQVALYNSAESYKVSKALAGQFAPARKAGVSAVFSDLPPGNYALAVFHDLNGNDELDSNLMGIPNEPYGFSRNARGRFGPPTFEDMSVVVGEASSSIEIEVQ